MKKNYTNQIYEEGLATSVYIPVDKAINKTSNNRMRKALKIFWKVLYTVLALLVAIALFLFTFPL